MEHVEGATRNPRQGLRRERVPALGAGSRVGAECAIGATDGGGRRAHLRRNARAGLQRGGRRVRTQSRRQDVSRTTPRDASPCIPRPNAPRPPLRPGLSFRRAGTGRGLPREQALSTLSLRGLAGMSESVRRAPAGCARDEALSRVATSAIEASGQEPGRSEGEFAIAGATQTHPVLQARSNRSRGVGSRRCRWRRSTGR